MRILITGCVGFIGSHLCKRLCERGDEVIGIDNMNSYYDLKIKELNLKDLEIYSNFKFFPKKY